MADNKDENEKKGGIVKIAIFAAAGLVLLGIGLGIVQNFCEAQNQIHLLKSQKY